MQDKRPQNRSPLSVEQLLQLKRHERPEQAFWDEFDRELHRRQLATVVNGRPWYSRLSQVGMVILRRGAPFGAAAAALAVGFVVFDHDNILPIDAGTDATQVAQVSNESTMVVLPAEEFDTRPAPVRPATADRPAPRHAESQFVVHQFELPPAPSRPWKTVAASNVLSISATAAAPTNSFEGATWTNGPALRAPAPPSAGSF